MTPVREAELIAEVAVWRERATREADRADKLARLIIEFGERVEAVEHEYDSSPASRVSCENLDCNAKMWREEAHIANDGDTGETAWCDACWAAGA